ncbi:MAG: amidohydrolase family protein [Acidobacteria bacterium]|nr:amidohydrolase family protein [Acidobacteriota bacterium]
MRIDSHQHFWRYSAAAHPWITDRMAAIQRDFLPPDLAPHLGAAGFDGSVLVQVLQNVEETRWLLRLADEHPSIRGVVGWVDLCSDEAVVQLDELSQHPRLVGVRHIVQAEPDGFMLRDDFLRGIAHLERFGLAYDVLVVERQLPEAVDFAARFPRQRFVLDHIAKPRIAAGEIREWRRHLGAMARLPNVVCKLSGMVTEADWSSWTRENVRPYLDAAIECFGPGRLMIGSDWPVCTLAATYEETMAIVLDTVAAWSEDERDAVLGGTAIRTYGLAR